MSDEDCDGNHPGPACGYDCPLFCAGRGGGGKDCGCSVCVPGRRRAEKRMRLCPNCGVVAEVSPGGQIFKSHRTPFGAKCDGREDNLGPDLRANPAGKCGVCGSRASRGDVCEDCLEGRPWVGGKIGTFVPYRPLKSPRYAEMPVARCSYSGCGRAHVGAHPESMYVDTISPFRHACWEHVRLVAGQYKRDQEWTRRARSNPAGAGFTDRRLWPTRVLLGMLAHRTYGQSQKEVARELQRRGVEVTEEALERARRGTPGRWTGSSGFPTGGYAENPAGRAPSFREGDLVVSKINDPYSGIGAGQPGVVLGFGGGSPYADPSKILVGVYWHGNRSEAFPRRGLERIGRLKFKAHPRPKFATAAQERAAVVHAIRDAFDEWMIQHIADSKSGGGWSVGPEQIAGIRVPGGSLRVGQTYRENGPSRTVFNKDRDGYRFVREYRDKSDVSHWALWERVQGKIKRVGTAHSHDEAREFLKGDPSFYAHHDNPNLILVHALNPPIPANVERAWCKFHQKSEYSGTTRDIGKIAGAPDFTFALGRCKDLDFGDGPREFRPRPWLVCSPDDHSLWIVSEEPMHLGNGVAGKKVVAVTYDPPRASGKEPAYYRHKFDNPHPELAPVGSPNNCRAILLQGGVYKVTDWIRN